MAAYYNEIDPFAADWLENLIAAGHIASGVVDRRSIEDVRPDDLRDFDQCHFFAGLGGWSLALRLAGFPDDGQVWTGSCPCQPFSAAGKRGGTADERHLWPAFFHQIEHVRPPLVFGEQVASRDGLDWLDLVLSDLEGADYDVAAADLCAAGVGAPHIRQRSWFVADAANGGRLGRRRNVAGDGREAPRVKPERLRDAGLMADASHVGRRKGSTDARRVFARDRPKGVPTGPLSGSATGLVADAHGGDTSAKGLQRSGQHGQQPSHSRAGFWADADWLHCIDGKARPVEPGTFPLAHGVPGRVGRLRAYGNAIVPQAAAAFIQAAIPFRLGVFA